MDGYETEFYATSAVANQWDFRKIEKY